MAEKLCLKWNDFQENINSAFGRLRKDDDFTDVTLACEDGQQLEAHKVILSVSSPLFENLLKRNKHNRPLIYMRGVKSEDLIAIIDFLYYGEANVFQENLDSFLVIAEELKLKGLTGQDTVDKAAIDDLSKPNPIPLKLRQTQSNWERTATKVSSLNPQSNKIVSGERNLAIPSSISGDLEELDAKVKSMMEKSSNKMKSGAKQAYIYKCKSCGKEGAGIAIRDHIEAHHVDGISLPCNNCGKMCRSRMSLRKHMCDFVS